MDIKMKTLGTVATYINGRAFKPSEWETEGKPIIRIQNLTNEDAPYNCSSKEFEGKYLVKNGNLLFAWSASLGAHIWKGPDAWLNQHIFKVVPNKDVDQSYLYYYLLTVVADLYSKTHGSGMVHITKEPFMNTPIPVPPLAEQKRIVSRIEELFSQLDDGVTTLKKTRAELAVYRQAVLKEAFEGHLTGSVPQSMIRLGDYIETPRYGTSKKCGYEEGSDYTAVFRIPNIDYTAGRISHEDIKYARFTENEIEGIRLKKDDILIIRSNGSVSLVGRAAKVSETDTSATFAGYLMRLRIKNPSVLLPKFVLLYLQSYQARVYIENKAKSTSGVHNINAREISDMELPLFDTETQLAIIDAIESRLSVYDSIRQTIIATLQQLEAMRQSILKDAFEGRL